MKEKILQELQLADMKTKDLTLMASGRKLVNRDLVSEIPERGDEPMVEVIATRKATTVKMKNDSDLTF